MTADDERPARQDHELDEFAPRDLFVLPGIDGKVAPPFRLCGWRLPVRRAIGPIGVDEVVRTWLLKHPPASRHRERVLDQVVPERAARHCRCHVEDVAAARSARHHDVHLGRASSASPKWKPLTGGRAAAARHLLARAEDQRLARADGGAHRLVPDRGAVVTHVALHHQAQARVSSWARRTGRRARSCCTRCSAACARSGRRRPRSLDGVGRADLGAGRRVAVHAHHRHGLRRRGAVDVVEVDHRVPLVRVALGAGLHARLAADAAGGIDEELDSRSGTGMALLGRLLLRLEASAYSGATRPCRTRRRTP